MSKSNVVAEVWIAAKRSSLDHLAATPVPRWVAGVVGGVRRRVQDEAVAVEPGVLLLRVVRDARHRPRRPLVRRQQRDVQCGDPPGERAVRAILCPMLLPVGRPLPLAPTIQNASTVASPRRDHSYTPTWCACQQNARVFDLGVQTSL